METPGLCPHQWPLQLLWDELPRLRCTVCPCSDLGPGGEAVASNVVLLSSSLKPHVFTKSLLGSCYGEVLSCRNGPSCLKLTDMGPRPLLQGFAQAFPSAISRILVKGWGWVALA